MSAVVQGVYFCFSILLTRSGGAGLTSTDITKSMQDWFCSFPNNKKGSLEQATIDKSYKLMMQWSRRMEMGTCKGYTAHYRVPFIIF